MSEFYNREGERIDLMEWATSFEKDERAVGKTEIGDVQVSTVWLGVDHSFGIGPPLLYETMIFGGEHDQFQERYTTEEQAKEGHERAVALVRSGSQSTAGKAVGGS